MRKTNIFISLFIVLLNLTACSNAAEVSNASQSTSENKASASTSQANGDLLSADYENALSVPMQLAIGTFKLDTTENKVDAKMAKDLLLLWKAVRSLSNSDTVASQELDALYTQIQGTMIPEQVAAISAMHLTRDDMRQVFQDMGMSFGPGGGDFGNLSPEQMATMQAAQQSGQGSPGGGFPGGGVPGMGGPPPGEGGNFSQEQRQTAMAAERGGASQSTQGVNPMLLDAVIKFLESKVQ
jgi:hypothetical protein